MAWNAQSVLVMPYSVLSKGVLSINQPTPLASWSMEIIPALGLPWESKPVIVASASCPVGKSFIS